MGRSASEVLVAWLCSWNVLPRVRDFCQVGNVGYALVDAVAGEIFSMILYIVVRRLVVISSTRQAMSA